MKWAVLGLNFFKPRYERLAEFLREQGIANEVHYPEIHPDEDIRDRLPEFQAAFDQLRIESPFREAVLVRPKIQSKMLFDLGAADCLIQKNRKWSLDVGLYYAFTQLFSRLGSKLDLKADMIVVGAGAAARLAVAAGLRAGFSKVNLSTTYDDQGIALLADLRKSFFGVDFKFVSLNQLVMLPGTNSLLVNTTPFNEGNEILTELYYLNFLKPDGMIWDMVFEPQTTPLIREGEQAGIACVRGSQVAALADCKWIEWVTGRVISDLDLLSYYKNSDFGPVTKNVTPE